MRRGISAILIWLFVCDTTAHAFWGLDLTAASQTWTNATSQMVVVRNGRHVVLTLQTGVQGDPTHFVLVIPVPATIHPDQIRVVPAAAVAHLVGDSQPLLVQHADPDPCFAHPAAQAPAAITTRPVPRRGAVPAMPTDATFGLGKYDLTLLSGAGGGGLMHWLSQNGYRLPKGAVHVITSDLRQHMHFLVARVEPDRTQHNPAGELPPIQLEYDSDKFLLPIRLGMLDADGPQDMLVLALSRQGQIETTNPRTMRMPTDVNVPEYIADRFDAFYDATFARQVAAAGGAGVFEEYAARLAGGGSLQQADLDALGAAGSGQLFLTRLHIRGEPVNFAHDLQFRETSDTSLFQVRYGVQIAWKGLSTTACTAGFDYRDQMARRWQTENASLASLTGWKPADIRSAMVAQWNSKRENDAP